MATYHHCSHFKLTGRRHVQLCGTGTTAVTSRPASYTETCFCSKAASSESTRFHFVCLHLRLIFKSCALGNTKLSGSLKMVILFPPPETWPMSPPDWPPNRPDQHQGTATLPTNHYSLQRFPKYPTRKNN